jgi:hypothetical protein
VYYLGKIKNSKSKKTNKFQWEKEKSKKGSLFFKKYGIYLKFIFCLFWIIQLEYMLFPRKIGFPV